MKAIVFTDPHVEEKAIPELEGVFKEILKYSKETPVLICVGDYYEKKNPNAREIEFGTKWAIKFKQAYPQFYMVTGNHPDIDGKISSVSYLEHLDIKVVPELVFDNTYYGHYMVQESKCGFNEPLTAGELSSKYELSILGHQHSYQDINGVVIHPGSIRYVDFGEVTDRGKYIMLVDECTYLQIRLNLVRPMYEIASVKDITNIPTHASVRIVISSVSQLLSEIDRINAIKGNYYNLVTKMTFDTIDTAQLGQVVAINKQDILNNWVNDIVNLEVKDLIIQELAKQNLC